MINDFTKPERQTLRVEEQILSLPLIGWRHVVVTTDDSLEVAVLPVEVTGLHGPAEHRPSGPGQRVLKKKKNQMTIKSVTILSWFTIITLSEYSVVEFCSYLVPGCSEAER